MYNIPNPINSDGGWVTINNDMWNINSYLLSSVTVSNNLIISLRDILPKDNFKYLLNLYIEASGSTATHFWVQSSITSSGHYRIPSTNNNSLSCYLPIDKDRKLSIYCDKNKTLNLISLILLGYRRLNDNI